VVTDPQTNKQTATNPQDRLQYTVPLSLAAQCNKNWWRGTYHDLCQTQDDDIRRLAAGHCIEKLQRIDRNTSQFCSQSQLISTKELNY